MDDPNLPIGMGRSLLLALPCSVLSCLVTLWVVNPSSQKPSRLQPEVDTERLLNQFNELRNEMDAHFMSPIPLTAPVVERQPIAAGDHLVEEMNGILARLENLQAIAKSSITKNQSPLNRNLPINWDRLDALSQLHKTNPAVARRSTMLLTINELIDRFGFPTSSHGTDAGLYFIYEKTPGRGSAHRTTFRFKDGLVIQYYPAIPGH